MWSWTACGVSAMMLFRSNSPSIRKYHRRLQRSKNALTQRVLQICLRGIGHRRIRSRVTRCPLEMCKPIWRPFRLKPVRGHNNVTLTRRRTSDQRLLPSTDSGKAVRHQMETRQLNAGSHFNRLLPQGLMPVLRVLEFHPDPNLLRSRCLHRFRILDPRS